MNKFDVVDGVLVSFNGDDTNVVVPSNVTTIGKDAFRENERIESVVVSEGVKVIDEGSFYYCSNLKKVSLPSSLVSIKDCAFSNCSSLESIDIPSNVEEIGEQAFFSCQIKNFTIGPKVSKIGYLAFKGNSIVESINVSEENSYFSSVDGVLYNKAHTVLEVYPQGKDVKVYKTLPTTKKIAPFAFANLMGLGENQKTFIINEGVSEIGERAFAASISVKAVYIPSTVKTIGESAFMGYGIVEPKGKVFVKKGSGWKDSGVFDEDTIVVEQ